LSKEFVASGLEQREEKVGMAEETDMFNILKRKL
jgi:hypothetical protein